MTSHISKFDFIFYLLCILFIFIYIFLSLSGSKNEKVLHKFKKCAIYYKEHLVLLL